MLLLSNQFENLTIVSLETEQPVGTVQKAIINPHKLALEGFYCRVPNKQTNKRQVLLCQDVRRLQGNKLFIDSQSEIVAAGQLIRLEETLRLNYQLTGKKVVTESQDYLGKVEEYVVESTSFTVQKIYVKQSFIKNLTRSNLVVTRAQIIKVTDRKIIVNDNVAEATNGSLKEAAEKVMGKPQVGVS